MTDDVTRALRECIVALRCETPRGLSGGTAFYVAPDLLLTCAHVVAGHAKVELLVAGQWQPAERIALQLSPAADVILLRSAAAHTHFVRLGRRAALHDPVHTRGFPVRNEAPHEDGLTGVIEAIDVQHDKEPWKSGARLLKFKGAQI